MSKKAEFERKNCQTPCRRLPSKTASQLASHGGEKAPASKTNALLPRNLPPKSGFSCRKLKLRSDGCQNTHGPSVSVRHERGSKHAVCIPNSSSGVHVESGNVRSYRTNGGSGMICRMMEDGPSDKHPRLKKESSSHKESQRAKQTSQILSLLWSVFNPKQKPGSCDELQERC